MQQVLPAIHWQERSMATDCSGPLSWSPSALAVVQEMVARMGVVTGKGLADLIRERFGVKITFWSMVLLLRG